MPILLEYYRTRSGLEIDIILQTQTGIIAMEVKSRKKLVPADIRPMRDIAKKLGKEWRGDLVVYRGDEIKKVGDPHIWAIPSHRLFI